MGLITKRIHVTEPQAPCSSWADGKCPPQFAVHVVTVALEDGEPIGKGTNQPVIYLHCKDGLWRRDGGFRANGDWIQADAGRPADIEQAIVDAEAKTQEMWGVRVKHQGVADHILGTVDNAERPGKGVLVSYVKNDDGWDVVTTTLAVKAEQAA